MQSKGSRLATGECRAIAAALLCVLAASCTSTSDPTLSLTTPGYTTASVNAEAAPPSDDGSAADSLAAVPQALMSAEGESALPDQVAYLPTAKPGGTMTAPASVAAAEGAPAAQQPQAVAAQADDASTAAAQQLAEAAPEQPAASTSADAPSSATPSPATAAQSAEFYVTATEPPAEAAAPKKKGFLASLFSSTPASAAPAPKPQAPAPAKAEPAKPVVTLASAEPARPLIASASAGGNAYSADALPGVRQTALFEIKRKSGLDDESDIDLNEEEDLGAYQVASAAGLARLAPNGLLKQTERVDVACLKPSLVRVLKSIEGHYGKKLMVTSGYRDPARNRRARGAKNSLHMYCAAADIQVPGVGKWELANYLRSMPGRGGVGTYCHTESVHVDVGPERDWNWRCRRRK